MATNFEVYENKIIDWIGAGNCSGFLIAGIKGVDVKETCAGHACHECRKTLAALLAEEHIELPKLTKRERAFCEAVQTGWIARDRNGSLCWFPDDAVVKKSGIIWHAEKYVCISHFKLQFLCIKWEDEKPWSIEDLLKLEVMDVQE